MKTEKTPHSHKEVSELRRLEHRFSKANSVLEAIRKSPELNVILDREGIRNFRELPDAVQIDLASGSVTSPCCLDFLFSNDATLNSKAKKVLLQIGKDRQIDNLVSKIWSRSAVRNAYNLSSRRRDPSGSTTCGVQKTSSW